MEAKDDVKSMLINTISLFLKNKLYSSWSC